MNNLQIREFSQTIINYTNQSPLPVETKRLALSEILSQLKDAADTAIRTELAERDRAELEKPAGEETQNHGNE